MDNDTLWQLISSFCELEGISLFDIERPKSGAGVLKIFIHQSKEDGGVQHSHCAGVSHRILNHELVEKMMPGNTTLEVSSPGINRKLSRPEHFAGAVGERVKVCYKPASDANKTTITGTLRSFNGVNLEVEQEGKPKNGESVIEVPLKAVHEAKIDFLFE